MTDPVKVIEKAIEQSPWAPGTDGWRDVEARYLARLALSALERAEMAVVPIEPTEAMTSHQTYIDGEWSRRTWEASMRAAMETDHD